MPRSALPESNTTSSELATAPDLEARAALDARYGRRSGDPVQTRWILWGTAAAFVLLFAAWLAWGGLLGAPADLEAKDVGHTIVDDGHVDVRFELTTNPGTPVSCALQALNQSFGIVGWRIIALDASGQRTRSITQSVRTSERAVTGLIYRCWLT